MSSLRFVLGDQLTPSLSALRGAASDDVVLMAEVADETTYVPHHRKKIVFVLAAMRAFADELRGLGFMVDYVKLDDPGNTGSLSGELQRAVARHRPTRIAATLAGEHRVVALQRSWAGDTGLTVDLFEDDRFICASADFQRWAADRKQLRMEYFYREMRRRHGVLMDGNDPAGGQWNFDADNRENFGRSGPVDVPKPLRVAPDAITREVIALVNSRFASHPGTLDNFGWPVSREDALRALDAFVRDRLPHFGRWQDALWPGEPWLWHAHISAALNCKLLSPREVVSAAENAWRKGAVPIASAEGFIRQILGWREYVRGIYWTQMPAYLERNSLDAHESLPAFYWNGETRMACMADAIGQTLTHGYAHHIQRLMVTGLYTLLLGVDPKEVHAWYLAVYVDAVEWVELPNTLGMSQAADGGLMASKPYIASGKYIERMSAGSLCSRCPYRPAERSGDKACPFTTLYWDFLLRHEQALAANPRTVMQVRNLARVDEDERARIRARAADVRAGEVP